MAGIVYLISTPIGNPEDLSIRALRVLKEVDIVAAEDPGHTERLFRHYGIHTPLTSYHPLNKEEKTAVLIQRMQAGQTVGFVSDEGTPLVSDPGSYLVKRAIAAGIRVIPVPGPSSFLAAVSASGLPTESFVFHGFLPMRRASRRQLLEAIKSDWRTHIFFEPPEGVGQALRDLALRLGNRKMVLACNLTSSGEEFVRGTLKQVTKEWGRNPRLGVVTIVLGGCPIRRGRRKKKRAGDV